MIEFNYDKTKIKIDIENNLVFYNDIEKRLENNKMFMGWNNELLAYDNDLITRIKQDCLKLKKLAKTMIVIGIGGSYLGSRAIYEALIDDGEYKLLFIGNNLDVDYYQRVIDYCYNNDFVINVISKSGTTLEPSLAFDLIKDIAIEKYNEEGLNKRLIITTDAHKGKLRELVKTKHYLAYDLNENIGGRFSVFTCVGLIPLAFVGIDITKIIEGASTAARLYSNVNKENDALKYATYRYQEYLNNSLIEAIAYYNPKLSYFVEWFKQLFAESEGKEHKGLLPIGLLYPTDLHSLGQFVQDGPRHIFETVIDFRASKDIVINKTSLINIKEIVKKSVIDAHYLDGDVNNYLINLNELNEYNLAYLMVFMMYSCAYSATLLDVEPFDQPGVEVYKANIKKMIEG